MGKDEEQEELINILVNSIKTDGKNRNSYSGLDIG
jgi:hypothetical protein